MVCECDCKRIPQSESVPTLTAFPTVNELELDTEVVVIGNGPAGISISHFSRGKSLIDQDLSWFQDECAERINPGVGPFAAFYDTLVRPPVAEERQFLDSGCHTSCLAWRHLRHRAVPHIVLGDGEVGGSWNSYDDDMVTVSMAHWMDLPCYPLAAWMGGKPLIDRLPAAVIRQYFQAYTKHMGIDYNFKPFSKVTSVMNYCYDPTGERYWQVSGLCRGLPFSIKCRKIVLACGRSHPRTLEVMGELNTTDSRVVYDVASMKRLLSIPPIYVDEPVPISSLCAADAVLHCLANSIPVLHLIRRNEKQIRSVMISRLSVAVYPEYAKVFRLMTKRERDPNYRCCTSSQIVSLDNQLRLAAIQTPHGIVNEPFNFIVACVGRQSQLEMLSGKFEFLANYQSSEDTTLFAIGSLAGDHFVRYLIGGALQRSLFCAIRGQGRLMKCTWTVVWMEKT
uniref:Uncharacterized protein n=1 Tax=Ditylenchus dipsaci TaxID=166011 RepID=A0A915E7B1_9BILA